jgi:hypothetical protein
MKMFWVFFGLVVIIFAFARPGLFGGIIGWGFAGKWHKIAAVIMIVTILVLIYFITHLPTA